MGPLEGVKVIELAGIGPAPFCAMLLSDMGAEVIRVDRASNVGHDDSRVGGPVGEEYRFNLLARGRRNIAVDLKNPAGVAAVLRLADRADALIEGFRPGVMERLGLGPEVCLARNPKLVYGRMTGWGQDGPIAHTAGHDINYIALSGVLYSIGEAGGPPVPPLNLVGDFGGGALYLAMGVLAGIISARVSGKGQVVDCSMVEGSASLMTMMYAALASGAWTEERGRNRTDGGAHYYHVYETKDGEYVAVGAIEPQFYALLLKHTGLDGESLPEQTDRSHLAGDARAPRAHLQREDARRMDRGHGADRHLLRTSPAHVGGAPAPAQPPPPKLCRDRRDHPAGPGAALPRHALACPAPAGANRRAHRRGAPGLGFLRRRNLRIAPQRRGREREVRRAG